MLRGGGEGQGYGPGGGRTERVASAVGGDGPVAGRPQEDVVAALVHHVEVVPVLALPRSRGATLREEAKRSGAATQPRTSLMTASPALVGTSITPLTITSF